MSCLNLSLSRLVQSGGSGRADEAGISRTGIYEAGQPGAADKNSALRDVEMVGADIKDYTPLLRCKAFMRFIWASAGKEEVTRQLEGSGLIIYAWEE